MHVHNGQNIQKIPTKVEIFKISLQIRIVYVPNKTVYRGKFTKIRVACIHGYSGLKSNQSIEEDSPELKLVGSAPKLYFLISEYQESTGLSPGHLALGLDDHEQYKFSPNS